MNPFERKKNDPQHEPCFRAEHEKYESRRNL